MRIPIVYNHGTDILDVLGVAVYDGGKVNIEKLPAGTTDLADRTWHMVDACPEIFTLEPTCIKNPDGTVELIEISLMIKGIY